MNIVGFISAIFLFGLNKVENIKVHNGCLVFQVKGKWGAVSMGLFIFADDISFYNLYTLTHETGHSIQNSILGPLFLLVIALPSLIHALLHNRFCKVENYYHFYTEKWANKLVGLE